MKLQSGFTKPSLAYASLPLNGTLRGPYALSVRIPGTDNFVQIAKIMDPKFYYDTGTLVVERNNWTFGPHDVPPESTYLSDYFFRQDASDRPICYGFDVTRMLCSVLSPLEIVEEKR